MERNGPVVLSASRRTDIPAFYMDWFMAGVQRGSFEVHNPFNRQVSFIPARPGDVHSIVFWSKDYGRFLSQGLGESLQRMGFGLFFHFTVNSKSSLLEPKIPPLSKRLAQMKELAARFGPEAVTWRFDPICHYRLRGRACDNLGGFWDIADAASACGVSRCVTSFVDLYRKVLKRARQVPGLFFLPISPENRAEILLGLGAGLAQRNISLSTCCEKEVLGHVPPALVKPSSCVDHGLLEKLFGPGLSHEKDKGQRAGEGCGCMKSFDVGSYAAHPCAHRCLYCYASPAAGPS